MEWYYAIDKEQKGPVTMEQLTELVRQGVIQGSTLVWHRGMAEWQPYEKATAAPTGEGAPPQLSSSELPSPEAWAERVRPLPAELSIGECYGKGWEMFQRNMGVTIGMLLLVFIGYLAISFVPFIGSVAHLVVYGGILCYFIGMVRGKDCTVGDAFAGFGPQFVPLMLAGFLVMLISTVCVLPGMIALIAGIVSMGLLSGGGEIQEAWEAATVGMIVLAVVGILLSALLMLLATVFLQFTYPLILDKGLDIVIALKLSISRCARAWFTLLLIMIIGGMLNIAGAIPCGLGLLFTIPLNFAALAVAYEKLFPGATSYVPAR